MFQVLQLLLELQVLQLLLELLHDLNQMGPEWPLLPTHLSPV